MFRFSNTLLFSAVLITMLSGCAELKEAGTAIGHATRDTTTAIGHATRDTTKAIGHASRDAVNSVKEDLSTEN